MLKKEVLENLAKRAGVSQSELKRVLESEVEEDLKFDKEGEFIGHDELETIKERAGKDSYKEGKIAGVEMFIKDIKLEEGLDIEGKTKDHLIKALKDKYTKDAGAEPTKRITELEADNKKLRDLYTEKEEELKSESEKFKSQLNGIEIEALIKGQLPEKLANGLTRDQAYKLYKSDRLFNKDESGVVLIDVVTKQVIKDKKLNPVQVSDDIKTFMEQFGEFDKGRGGGDDKFNHRKSNLESMSKRSEVEEYFEKNSIPLSEQSAILAKAMKNDGFKISE